MKGGMTHGSRNEFFSDALVEREADSFAAGLLMPSRLMRPKVNAGELSFARVKDIAKTFKTSLVSTMIRSVQLSDFPCAVVAIRDARVAWSFLSASLNDAGCYPLQGGAPLPSSATRLWEQLTSAPKPRYECDGLLDEWFRTYDRDLLSGLLVHSEARWVESMGTFLAPLRPTSRTSIRRMTTRPTTNNQPRPEAVVLGRPPEGAVYVRLPPLGAWSWSGPGFSQAPTEASPLMTNSRLIQCHARVLPNPDQNGKSTPDRSKLFGSHGQRPWF